MLGHRAHTQWHAHAPHLCHPTCASQIDYVYAETGRFVTTGAAIVRNAPGGSDHFPVTAEVVML
jgi:endonuclease/exonuclease/phosphatase family metal-dependent hydrolase